MARTSSDRFFAAFCAAIICLCCITSTANAQARWLKQKTRGFSSGKSAADVLGGLATAHKFKVEYQSETIKSDASETLIHGNLDGVPLETTLRLVFSGMSVEDEIPWTANKSTLNIHDPR